MSRDDDIAKIIHTGDGKLLSPEQISMLARMEEEAREIEANVAILEWQRKRGIDAGIAEKAADARARGVKLTRTGKARQTKKKEAPIRDREHSLGKRRAIRP